MPRRFTEEQHGPTRTLFRESPCHSSVTIRGLLLSECPASRVVAPFVRIVPFVYRTDKQARASVQRAIGGATSSPKSCASSYYSPDRCTDSRRRLPLRGVDLVSIVGTPTRFHGARHRGGRFAVQHAKLHQMSRPQWQRHDQWPNVSVRNVATRKRNHRRHRADHRVGCAARLHQGQGVQARHASEPERLFSLSNSVGCRVRMDTESCASREAAGTVVSE